MEDSSKRAFSLVEVVVAIGIVAFALMTLVALLPIGINAEQVTDSESAAINLLGAINSDLRNSFTNSSSACFGIKPTPFYATNAVSTNVFFSQQQLIATNAADLEKARFRAALTYFPATTNSVTRIVTPCAMLIQIFWPAHAGPDAQVNSVESYVLFPEFQDRSL